MREVGNGLPSRGSGAAQPPHPTLKGSRPVLLSGPRGCGCRGSIAQNSNNGVNVSARESRQGSFRRWPGTCDPSCWAGSQQGPRLGGSRQTQTCVPYHHAPEPHCVPSSVTRCAVDVTGAQTAKGAAGTAEGPDQAGTTVSSAHAALCSSQGPRGRRRHGGRHR